MNLVKIRANVLNCSPYFYKDGERKGEVKGYILEFFEVKRDKSGNLRAEVSKYFPTTEVLQEDVAEKIDLFTAIEMTFDIRSLNSNPVLTGLRVLDSKDVFDYPVGLVVDIDKI